MVERLNFVSYCLIFGNKVLSILCKGHIIFLEFLLRGLYLVSIDLSSYLSTVHDCKSDLLVNWGMNFLLKGHFGGVVLDGIYDFLTVFILLKVLFWQILESIKLLCLVEFHVDALSVWWYSHFLKVFPVFLIDLLSNAAYSLRVNFGNTILLYYGFYYNSLCIKRLDAFFIDYLIF